MKKSTLFYLMVLPFCCFSQSNSISIDALFKKFCGARIMAEIETDKFQFDTSEAIIITCVVINYSKKDSMFFASVPGGANFDIGISLKNLGTGEIYYISNFLQPGDAHQTGSIRYLAPGERFMVFSTNLRELAKRSLSLSTSETAVRSIYDIRTKPIHLPLGIYELKWSGDGVYGISKPFFFQIK